MANAGAWVLRRTKEIVADLEANREPGQPTVLNYSAIHLQAVLEYMDACGLEPLQCQDGEKEGHRCPSCH